MQVHASLSHILPPMSSLMHVALPLRAVTYTTVAQRWRAAPGVLNQQLDTLIGQIDGERFEKCWDLNKPQLLNLQFMVRQCTTEKSDDGPYTDGGVMVEGISRILLSTPGPSSSGGPAMDPRPAYLFYNKAGTDGTRPDVAWCGMSSSVSPLRCGPIVFRASPRGGEEVKE